MHGALFQCDPVTTPIHPLISRRSIIRCALALPHGVHEVMEPFAKCSNISAPVILWSLQEGPPEVRLRKGHRQEHAILGKHPASMHTALIYLSVRGLC